MAKQRRKVTLVDSRQSRAPHPRSRPIPALHPVRRSRATVSGHRSAPPLLRSPFQISRCAAEQKVGKSCGRERLLISGHFRVRALRAARCASKPQRQQENSLASLPNYGISPRNLGDFRVRNASFMRCESFALTAAAADAGFFALWDRWPKRSPRRPKEISWTACAFSSPAAAGRSSESTPTTAWPEGWCCSARACPWCAAWRPPRRTLPTSC
eukprot:scaffold1659_cov255-Pinguiococcus_pyrenoidosus.AAC.43